MTTRTATRRTFTVERWAQVSRLGPELLRVFARELVAQGLAVEIRPGVFELTPLGREVVRAIGRVPVEAEA